MTRRKTARNKPQRPRIGKRKLGEMIEAATVDSNSESEQLMGWLTMIGDNLAVPCRWLRRMLKEGEIELTTESERSPGAKYRLRLRGPG
jgi:hypothetical protein